MIKIRNAQPVDSLLLDGRKVLMENINHDVWIGYATKDYVEQNTVTHWAEIFATEPDANGWLPISEFRAEDHKGNYVLIASLDTDGSNSYCVPWIPSTKVWNIDMADYTHFKTISPPMR